MLTIAPTRKWCYTRLIKQVFININAYVFQYINSLNCISRILHSAESLELRAFTLQCLLAMNRPDLARKQLKLLQDIEDDGTLTQLAQAWLNLSQVTLLYN
jgi:coatomer subunit epsilon